MKQFRLFTLAILMIASSSASYAGNGDGDGKIGVRAGYVSSNIFKSGDKLNDNIYGSFYVGVFKEQKIIPLLSLGSGFEYQQIGSFNNSDNKITMHYLSIPANLKLKLGPVYILAGAAPAFKVAEKWTVAGSKMDPLVDNKWFDIPVHAGLGIQILMFRIEARYHWGMLDLYDSPLEGYKTQAFQLGLAVAI